MEIVVATVVAGVEVLIVVAAVAGNGDCVGDAVFKVVAAVVVDVSLECIA